jgi:class 3 adenylate cyclase
VAAGNVEPVSLPHGVVTFVFSDIEGSTRLWETDADGMRLSLARHDEIVQREIAAVGGHRFKHTGDGFGAAFESVSAGIDAAAGVARAMDRRPGRAGARLPDRGPRR